MTDPHDVLSRTRTVVRPARPAEDRRLYLLVVDGQSSSFVRLPPTGVLLVGRANDAAVRLFDDSVSRQHARLIVSGGTVRIVDLESHNGVVVNGQRIHEARELASGDVVGVGQVTIVLHDAPERAQASGLAELADLRAMLHEEIARAIHYGRTVSVLALGFAGAADPRAIAERLASALRPIDVAAWTSSASVAVLAPGTPEDELAALARRAIDALASVAPGTRVGYAVSPADGSDPDTLLAAARAAVESAAPGELGDPDGGVQERVFGDTRVILAEPAMIHLFALVERLAAAELSVLVTGETGTGKEVVAQAIHHASRRAKKPLVAVNCAALPEALLESELFGHERGAFTGAVAAKPGVLERAHGGTVFLDELGELSPSAQAKLLRALETRRFTRLGAADEREVDVRIIAATNRDLSVEVEAGRFRKDLYFRLGAATVSIPPLRDRRRDLPVLARRFLEDACARAGRPALELSPAALQRLSLYDWPGNVRELKNAIDYCAALAPGPIAGVEHLPETLRDSAAGVPDEPRAAEAPRDGMRPLHEEVAELEKTRILEALERANGVQKRAAELIDMPRRTFLAKLERYGIPPRRGRPS